MENIIQNINNFGKIEISTGIGLLLLCFAFAFPILIVIFVKLIIDSYKFIRKIL